MFPAFLMPESWHKLQEERHKREVERRYPLAVPWDLNVKWQPELTFKADTYKVLSLFDVKPTNSNNVNHAKPGELVLSPKKRYCYQEKRLQRGGMLRTVNGRKRGDVMWDGPVLVPALHERCSYNESRWEEDPWMSLTPMEMMTLRPGTKRAKGRVIIAGLGLGHQLIEVSKRKQVKEIILVEQSQELVDWVLPRIEPHLDRGLTDVVVGDAYKVLQKMKADIALIDIFKSYGHNDFMRWVPDGNARGNREEPVPCPGIKRIWCWGSAKLGD